MKMLIQFLKEHYNIKKDLFLRVKYKEWQLAFSHITVWWLMWAPFALIVFALILIFVTYMDIKSDWAYTIVGHI